LYLEDCVESKSAIQLNFDKDMESAGVGLLGIGNCATFDVPHQRLEIGCLLRLGAA
jgi:hypothetical protein